MTREADTHSGGITPGGQVCPDCGMQRTRFDISYCEVCRFQFAPQEINPKSSIESNIGGPATMRWEVSVVVDPSLYTDPDPLVRCPVNEPERLFNLDLVENFVGRRSESKKIYPTIPIQDPGISHRHCKLLKESDESLWILDVGSTNGTELNGVDLPAGVKKDLKNGDQITLGCWTRITVRKV